MDREPIELRRLLAALVERRELTPVEMTGAMRVLLAGSCPEAEAAAFLMGLRMKGETAGEIAAAAGVLREKMIGWRPPCDGVLDTCGTGGDGLGTFNISTATALVVAAAGVPVVKHGNRSASGRTGSADVLEALGVRIDGDADFAGLCLQEAGFAFCFAPHFHPALGPLAPLRKRLGIPTLFNCLGPLANPAAAPRQLLGVGRLDLLDRMAHALARLGTTHALVVCSRDGLDEVSLSAPTEVREVRGGEVFERRWSAEDFGLDPVPLADLDAADTPAAARLLERVLAGEDLPATRVVLANAAAGLLAAEKVAHPREGVEQARHALASGRARHVLATLQKLGRTEARHG